MDIAKVGSIGTVVNNFGHGSRAGGSHGGELSDAVTKYLEHALKDGKIDRREAKMLEKLNKAEQRCGDDKKCGEEKECGDKRDRDCGDDKLIDRYLKDALKDGRLSSMERRVLDRLYESSDRSSFA